MTSGVEVLFCCDASDSQSSCTVWDFRTGTSLMTYRSGGNIQYKSLSLFHQQFVVAANMTKPLFNVWPINHHDPIISTRFVAPGRVSAMTLSPDGLYLVAGVQENLYVWHLLSGRMMNTIAIHYQSINCICFTSDSSHFVSAGQDGSVLVWNLTKVVSRRDDNQSPRYTFTDHGLAVRDCRINGFGLRSYLFTISLDRTCKIYDLSCGILLQNVVFPEGLNCVMVNAMETDVYVGTTEGHIFEFHVNSLPRTKEYNIDSSYKNKLQGHKPGTAVNCMALSRDGHTLLSGGQDHQVCIWTIPSRQLLKTIQFKGSITNMRLEFLHSSIFNPENKISNIFTKNLKRMMDPPETDDDWDVEVFVSEANAYTPKTKNMSSRQIVHELLTYSGLGQQNVESPSKDAANTVLANLQSEKDAKNTAISGDNVDKLREEIAKLKSINKTLFENISLYVLKNSKKQ